MPTIDNDFGDGIRLSWRRLDFADNNVLITQSTAALIFFRHTEMCFIKQMLRTTDMPGQTVQTQIRLLLYQGLHCLPFCLHHLDSLLYGRAT